MKRPAERIPPASTFWLARALLAVRSSPSATDTATSADCAANMSAAHRATANVSTPRWGTTAANCCSTAESAGVS